MAKTPEQKFREDWWEIRMFLKPKIINAASLYSQEKWHHKKKELKAILKDEGPEIAMKVAQTLVLRLRELKVIP